VVDDAIIDLIAKIRDRVLDYGLSKEANRASLCNAEPCRLRKRNDTI
jgi:hypothetical protein